MSEPPDDIPHEEIGLFHAVLGIVVDAGAWVADKLVVVFEYWGS